MAKRLIALFLVCALLSGCTLPAAPQAEEPAASTTVTTCPSATESTAETVPFTTAETVPAVTEEISFQDLSNPLVLTQLEETIYSELILELDSADFFVEQVEAVYISSEYLEELEFNSQSNIYFGYTLEELNAQYSGTRYVFTLGEDGETTVQAFQEYENPYAPVIKNMTTGAGVLLVSVTIATVLSGNPVSISTVFSFVGKYGGSAVIAGITSFAVSIFQSYTSETKPATFDEALRNAAIAGSDKFKVTVFSGVVKEAAGATVSFLCSAANGLSKRQAAEVQQESGLPLEFINSFHSQEEYNVYRDAGLSTGKVNGQWAFIRDIDWFFTDSEGRTNAQRVREGLSPLDPTGESYELHHIGQMVDSPLAILTSQEHQSNYSILHANTGQTQGEQPSQGSEWAQQRRDFWKALLEMSGFSG